MATPPLSKLALALPKFSWWPLTSRISINWSRKKDSRNIPMNPTQLGTAGGLCEIEAMLEHPVKSKYLIYIATMLKFREINSLVTYLTKTLIWRENVDLFHIKTVNDRVFDDFSKFWQKFRESNVLNKLL